MTGLPRWIEPPPRGVTFVKGTDMSQAISLNSQNRYEIKVCGQPDDSWRGWFGEVKVHSEVLADSGPVTTFSDVVMDQAGLVGLIRRLHGYGIVLISVRIMSYAAVSSWSSSQQRASAPEQEVPIHRVAAQDRVTPDRML